MLVYKMKIFLFLLETLYALGLLYAFSSSLMAGAQTVIPKFSASSDKELTTGRIS